ncbi:MAG TPA: hypothetical protein VHX38_07535 [Pseudonocardiaceae bacterium]|jgi:hypothetical protein|nr:hypothetical protein [Pseudonocardiaceae bacterium]
MPLSSAVRKRARAFLPPGTEIHYLFPAMSAAGGRGAFGTAPFVVAVTDTQVTVLGCGWFSRKPTSVLAQYPRSIQLGPVDTSVSPTFAIGGLVMETDEEYVPVIRAADAELSQENCLPPDPLPHL